MKVGVVLYALATNSSFKNRLNLNLAEINVENYKI